MNTGCAILAGGTATRLGGQFKPEILIGGRKILDRILDAVYPIFSEIILVTNRKDLLITQSNIITTSDVFISKGPLAGIHAAMEISKSDALFIVAGDMPFLDKGLIEDLLTRFISIQSQALVPRHSGLIEPLHSFYKVETISLLEKVLNEPESLSVTYFLKGIDISYYDVNPAVANRVFKNINTEKDL